MDGASGGPRSATELAAAARGLKELLDTSLLPQDVYDARLAALKAEAAELVAAPRARSSMGDAASPAPTTVTPVAAAGADTAAVQQPSEGSAPPPPPQPSAAAAPAQPPREKRERSEAAAAAALRVLKPAPPLKPAAAGSRSILSMPGFSKSVVSSGVTYVVEPPPLNFGRYKCCHAGAATARAAQRPRVHRTHQRSAATCLRALAAPALRNPAQRSQLLIFRGPPPLRRGLNFLKFAPALRAGRWLTS